MDITDYNVFFFDFDGLLVDTEPLYYQACLRTWQSYGISIEMDYPTYYAWSSLGKETFCSLFTSTFPETAVYFPRYFQDRNRLYQSLLQEKKVSLLPGVASFLSYLASLNKKMGVVTNSPLSVIAKMRAFLPELEVLQFWVTRECYERAKPFPDSYRYAYERFVLPGEKVIGFEDSIKGLRALSKIPATCVGINAVKELSPHDHEDLLHVPWYYFHSFEELQREEQNQS